MKPIIILLHVDDRTNLCTRQAGCECKCSQSAEPVRWLLLASDAFEHLLLEPKLCILDESDSGLDVDALQVVADGVNSQRDGERSFIVVTHYQRLLDYIKPDFVHILADGKIVKSGDASLALEVEKSGYAFLGKAYEEAEA